jgi:hypothetical protein
MALLFRARYQATIDKTGALFCRTTFYQWDFCTRQPVYRPSVDQVIGSFNQQPFDLNLEIKKQKCSVHVARAVYRKITTGLL